MPPRPLLAETVELDHLDQLTYPLCASFKFDGIRALLTRETAWSRSGRPLPNAALQAFVHHNWDFLDGVDCEVMVRNDSSGYLPFYDVPESRTHTRIRGVQSWIMAQSGEPDFELFCIDLFDVALPFADRYAYLQDRLNNFDHKRVTLVEQELLYNSSNVEVFATRAAAAGHEGVMLRAPNTHYKQGRSTLREQTLLKLKPFRDAEAKVIGFKQRMINTNPSLVSPLGFTEHSTCAEGLQPVNMLGALVCFCPLFSETFEIGTGYSDAQAEAFWLKRDEILAAQLVVNFKYQAHGSTASRPRSPVFQGFRTRQ